MANLSLEGKIIFITGGTSGIGYEVALKCAKEGARVIVASRNEKNLAAIVKVLKKISFKDHDYHVLDVGDRISVERCAKWVKEKYKFIDGLVNCAGILDSIGRFDQVDLDDFGKTVQTNFFGTVFMCYYFFKLLKKRNGRIVNFSGGGATSNYVISSAYASSKAAVVRFTENLSEEFKDLNISINAVAPGFVVTRIHDKALRLGNKVGKSYQEFMKNKIKKGGVSPDEGANLTIFLLSDRSKGINGKLISAHWDPWEKDDFIDQLKNEKDLATIRRIDNRNFREIRDQI